MRMVYHSIPFEVLMNERYRDFMKNFGENVQHVIDCDQTNDEIISRTKGYLLTSRHKVVCPSLIPIATPKLIPYGQINKEKLEEFYRGFKVINSLMGAQHDLMPLVMKGK